MVQVLNKEGGSKNKQLIVLPPMYHFRVSTRNRMHEAISIEWPPNKWWVSQQSWRWQRYQWRSRVGTIWGMQVGRGTTRPRGDIVRQWI